VTMYVAVKSNLY